MVDIFDEVDEDLRADRARRFFRNYGWLLLIGAGLVVAGVAGFEVWQTRQAAAREAVASEMLAAIRLADPIRPGDNGPARAEAIAAFEKIAASAPNGYRVLARLRLAGLKRDGGDAEGAAALWDQVASDGSADTPIRDLATILWAEARADSGDPAGIESRLRPLAAPDNQWRFLAGELLALLELRQGHEAQARERLARIAAEPVGPQDIRARANALVVSLGGEPAAPADGAP